jgi:uncharacterized protein YraI
MHKLTVLLSVLFVFTLSACAQKTPTQPTIAASPTAGVLLMPTDTAVPVPATNEPLSPTPTPQAVTTSAPYQPFEATISVDNFKLRSGPGFLFDAIALYAANEKVLIIGAAPGEAWYFVQTSDHLSGWMKAEYLEFNGDAASIPLIQPGNVQTVIGHVTTNDTKQAASGIGVLISPQKGYSGTNGDNTLTDASGTFYFYLPPHLEGDFFVELNGYNCEGNLMVGRCELPYKFPIAQPLTLPMPQNVTLEFVLTHY